MYVTLSESITFRTRVIIYFRMIHINTAGKGLIITRFVNNTLAIVISLLTQQNVCYISKEF